jgi:hypothetical protein
MICRTSVQVHALESRVLLAASPADVLTGAMRQTLLDNMVLGAERQRSLKHKLRAHDHAAFDQQLLDYTRARDTGKFFFDVDHDTIASYAGYITESLSPGSDIERADKVLGNRYPEQDSSADATVRVPEDVDWDSARYSSNPETVHTLNRLTHWQHLAVAHRLTGEDAYADRIVEQLGDWSAESPAPTDANDWPDAGPQWNRLNAAVRAERWAWTYALMVSSPRWTKETNTLMLVEVLDHGRFLYEVDAAPITSNHAISHGQGLLYLAQLFPEFSNASRWERRGRDLLFRGMDAQLYNDGSHVEQSPGYAEVILGWLLESKRLDERNGDAWPARRSAKLTAAIDAYHEVLSPNGATPAIGDTYRRSAVTLWLKASVIQNESRWPAAKPRARDAWMLGPDAVRPFESNPVTPPLSERPRTFALRDSGNYLMRSGSDANARQITFDAGPKGGAHGHVDLLSFELSGYGRPLISDPGPYLYDTSARRAWAVSTPAHNTVSIDGLNHAELEGSGNPGFQIDAWRVADDFVQVTAHHEGYARLRGGPIVARSIWFDYDDTMLVVDWVESTAPHDLKTSFLLPGTDTARDLRAGWIRSDNADGGNVRVQAILQPGQAATYRTDGVFTSSDPPPNHRDAATQFFVYQNASFAVFATLITTYEGDDAPDLRATLVGRPGRGDLVTIRLNDDGDERDITFAPPARRLDENATTRGTYSDIAFDGGGRLHLAYFDRDDANLKYAVRDRGGRWSRVQTIDPDWLSGYQPSIAVDGEGRVGAAYTDAQHGDLKYAVLSGDRWVIETVDVRGSTGHYPSLAFSRGDEPAVTYYDKTNGDLRLAARARGRWRVTTIDAGVVGSRDVGRFSELMLDPARPDHTNWAIAYEDTGGARYLYAAQGKFAGGAYDSSTGFTAFTVARARKLGGYASLAFDSAARPHVSFYDSSISGLRFAESSGSTSTAVRFTASTVTERGAVGYYSNLTFDGDDVPAIYYFDRTRNRAMRAQFTGQAWATAALAPGGRELHVARRGDTVALTNLDESVPRLEVLFL